MTHGFTDGLGLNKKEMRLRENDLIVGIEKIINCTPRRYNGDPTPAEDIVHRIRNKSSFELNIDTLSQIKYQVEIPDNNRLNREVMAGETKTKRITRKQASRLLAFLVTGKVTVSVPRAIAEEIELGNQVNLYNAIMLMES